ncbi:MAG: energy transducer TonB [Pseudomonadota bacterium]
MQTAPELATQPEPEPAPPAVERPPAAGASAPRELRGQALHSALAALAREEFYPRAAIERGLEGRVVLLLTLDAAGRVVGAEVADSSGHPLLDVAARAAATRIGRLPVGRRQALLPVEFRLD